VEIQPENSAAFRPGMVFEDDREKSAAHPKVDPDGPFVFLAMGRLVYVANRSSNFGMRRLRVRGASRGGAHALSDATDAGDSSGAVCCPRTEKPNKVSGVSGLAEE
jgi:hypothetical protein